MTLNTILFTAFLCLLPISELRGGLPYALAQGIPPVAAVSLAILFNAAAVPLSFLFLTTIHRLLLPWRLYARLFDRLVVRARHRVEKQVERYGAWGLILFVAVPLPVTGAYTGSLGAWVLGLSFRKAFLPILVGICIAAAIVSSVFYLVTIFGVEALRIFIKG